MIETGPKDLTNLQANHHRILALAEAEKVELEKTMKSQIILAWVLVGLVWLAFLAVAFHIFRICYYRKNP